MGMSRYRFVPLCLFSTRLKQNFVCCCFPRACVRVADTHGDVLNRHTALGSTRGLFSRFLFSVPQHTGKIGMDGRNGTNECRFFVSTNHFANFSASQWIFLLDMSRTNIGEGREDRTLHRTQHASNVHVSPNASALAQGLSFKSACESRVKNIVLAPIVIPPFHVLSQPPGPVSASFYFS